MLSDPPRSSGLVMPWVPALAPPREQYLLLWSLSLKQDNICQGLTRGGEESPLPFVLHPLIHPVNPINPYPPFQGNDQVRFELTCYSLAPQIKVRCCSSPGGPCEQDMEVQ